MTVPTLWHFPVSHYNEKARWGLDWKRVPHRREALFLDYIPRAYLRTRQLSLPILLIDGRAVPDSTAILAELERRHSEPPLYPADPTLRARALGLEDFFDERLGPALRTAVVGEIWDRDPQQAIELLATGNPDAPVRLAKLLLRPMRAIYRRRHHIRPATQATARGEVEACLDRIEREVGASGYLVGDAFSVADLTAAALLGIVVRPPELEYPLPDDLLPDYARGFADAVAARPAAEWVRTMYRRHRGASAEIRPGAASYQ